MRVRKQFLIVLVFAAACISVGCRSGVSAHGHSLSLFLVPMYKQPAGFSSTYKQHLAMTPSVIEYAVGEWSDTDSHPVVPATGDSAARSDKVIFPQPCGPECRQPAADSQEVSIRSASTAQPSNRIAKRYSLIKPQ